MDYVTDGELASLELLDISEAEKHGTLKHCASVYNADNDRIEPGLGYRWAQDYQFCRYS